MTGFEQKTKWGASEKNKKSKKKQYQEAISVKGSRGEYRNPREFHIPFKEIELASRISKENFLAPRINSYTAELSERWPNRKVVFKMYNNNDDRNDTYDILGLRRQMFYNELNIVSRFQHENIIPYIGYCDEGGNYILIYEHAINGSLRDHLQDQDKLRCIPWEQRLKICLGAARGLKCLHFGLWDENRFVVHRHIRSKYILLDENMEAKISEFGLSTFVPKNKPQVFDDDWKQSHKTILYTLKGERKIVLAVASSGIAYLLLPAGRTNHSRFKIPLDLTDTSVCAIKKNTQLADLLKETCLIMWEESPMNDRRCFETLGRTLRDILNQPAHLFSGKTVMLGGDFRQSLPVNRENMRLNNKSLSEIDKHRTSTFAQWLLDVGNGQIGIPDSDPDNTSWKLHKKAIVCPKNDTADIINDKIISLLTTTTRTYLSYDDAIPHTHDGGEIKLLYPKEYLNSLSFQGLPPHNLTLKVGSPVMLLHNMNIAGGLCNGTRLIVSQLLPKAIEARIITGTRINQKVFLPCILSTVKDPRTPFIFRRKQFPVKVCYAMTINKAQGQSLKKIGTYLAQPAFGHGQLYVALSRSTTLDGLKILINFQIEHYFNFAAYNELPAKVNVKNPVLTGLQLSGTSATHYYLNPNIPETYHIKEQYQQLGNTVPILNIHNQRHQNLKEEKYRNQFPLATLLEVNPPNYQIENPIEAHKGSKPSNPTTPSARKALFKDTSEIESPERLSTDQQIALEGRVSNKEIKRAVWDCGTEKAPGQDGFTFGFYRQFWYLIENDVYNAVKYFFLHGEIPKGCNSSFISLILKITGANVVKDFRPISLIGSLYKIIAKILANRLVGKLGKKQLLVFKVDFEKAYDSVRWDFLDDILRKFGFGDKWCKWIQTCLRYSRGSIILNGSPTEEFQFYKGVKQGDPLFPFLFILVMESLHLSFQRVEEAGMFKGIKLDNLVFISHMFYADDVVFVGQCDKIKRAASKLECLTFKTPFMYLGSIVGGSMSRIQAWDDVVDQMIALASKEKGGLGISSLYALNRCLMFKWFWRFCTQDTSSWSRVIKAIYGETGSVDGNVNSGFKTCWMNIVQEVNSLVGKGIDLRKFICFKLGNGEKASFWDDIRPIGGVEQQQFEELLTLINGVRLVPMGDRWTWKLSSSGEFSVASVRHLIDDKTLPDATQKTR
nr:DNA helicase [Tanacetum cinerariifolium]